MRIKSLWVLFVVLFAGCSQFYNGPGKSAEGQTKSNLQQIRSAINIYFGETQGEYPKDLSILIFGKKYLPSIPYATPAIQGQPYHPKSNEVKYFSSRDQADDTSGWGYVNNPASRDFGTVFVNCTHRDSKGIVWNKN